MTKKINNRLENGIHNYNRVLNIIINEDGVSRTEISKITGLSASSVTNITNKLLVNNLIKESDLIPSDNIGRKAVQLRLNPLGGFFICMVFGKKSVRLDFYNLERRRGNSYYIPINEKSITGEFLIEKIEEEVQYNYKYGRFFGIMLVLPSVAFDCREGGMDYFGYRLEEDCIEKIKRFYKKTEVLVEPTCVVSAYRLVERKRNKNILCAEIGNGIASSVILSDKFLDDDKFSFKLEDFRVLNKKNGKTEKFIDCFSKEYFIEKYFELTGKRITFENLTEEYLQGKSAAVSAVDESLETASEVLKELTDFMGVDYFVIGGERAVAKGLKKILGKLNSNAEQKMKVITVDDDEDLSVGGVSLVFDMVFSYENNRIFSV